MATTLADIHPDIIQTHILPRLDGQSLFSTATTSSSLQAICAHEKLWSHICKSTWPSITDPRLHHLISTFPAGHFSFFRDSFPVLIITDVDQYDISSTSAQNSSLCDLHGELISAVDIYYKNEIVYSRVELTETTKDFLWSPCCIDLKDDRLGISKRIDVKVDELLGANKATLSHLKESLTLSWILIDPTRKRAVNLSSIKPVEAMHHWMGNESLLQYVTVLPGMNGMVQCRIEVTLGVDDGGVGLHVKEVLLNFEDFNYRCLNGREALVIMQGAISEESNVRRKVVEDDDEELWRCYRKFKEIKQEKMAWGKKEKEKGELAIEVNCIAFLFFFYFVVYFVDFFGYRIKIL